MPTSQADFDNLVRVITEVKDRIETDPYSGRDETRTRLVFIGPLLQALGWDPTARVVIAEYRIQSRRFRPQKVDYALLRSPEEVGYPIAFIEAKRLNGDLDAQRLCSGHLRKLATLSRLSRLSAYLDAHLHQALAYANQRKSVNYVCLTNGGQWKFYDVSDATDPRCIFEVSIRDEPALECAKQLQPLVRSNLISGNTAPSRPPPSMPQPAPTSEHPVPSSFPQNLGEPLLEIGKVLRWFIVAFSVGSIASYAIGFRTAQPVLQELVGIVGAIVVGIVLVASLVFILPRLSWGWLSWHWLWPLRGKTLTWSMVVIIVGGFIGSVLGYRIGFATAQSVFDLLAGVGAIVIGVVILAVMGLVVWSIAQSNGSQGRSYYRRRGRRRR